MSVVIATPGDKTIRAGKHEGDELQALLEAISLIEIGALPIEILKKIA